MPRDKFTHGSIGFTIIGILGVITMTASALDPVSRASDGLANAVAGILFFLAIGVGGAWMSFLAMRAASETDPWAEISAPDGEA